MQKLIIKGKKELIGKILISGSKNATLPILAASILANQVKLKNIPLVKDIFTMVELLNFIGLDTKFFKNFVFSPIKLSNSIIVKISLTKGIFLSFTRLAKIDAAKIGRVAFLDPDIEIFPINSLLPLIISFCIKKI